MSHLRLILNGHRETPRMRSLLFCLFLLTTSIHLSAEVQDWKFGKEIEVPVQVSTENNGYARTVVFPSAEVDKVEGVLQSDILQKSAVSNRLTLVLTQGDASDTLNVTDDKGRLYVLKVRGARANEQVDSQLILRNPADDSPATTPGQTTTTTDTDGHAVQMMRVMLGGAQYSDIQARMVSEVRNGELAPGKIIISTDELALVIIRMYQSPYLRGYHAVLSYHGTKPIRVNYQKLWMPRLVCVYVDPITVANPDSPDFSIEPNQTINLYFVTH